MRDETERERERKKEKGRQGETDRAGAAFLGQKKVECGEGLSEEGAGEGEAVGGGIWVEVSLFFSSTFKVHKTCGSAQ